MSRPVGVRTSKKRNKTARVYLLGVEVRVTPTSKLTQKDILSNMRRLVKSINLMSPNAIKYVYEPVRLTVIRNVDEHFRNTFERYRQRVISETPRTPSAKAGNR